MAKTRSSRRRCKCIESAKRLNSNNRVATLWSSEHSAACSAYPTCCTNPRAVGEHSDRRDDVAPVEVTPLVAGAGS